MSEIIFIKNKIIRTKHGEYITIITEDFDILNINIDTKIESYDKSYNLTKNIYKNIKNFKEKIRNRDENIKLLSKTDKN
jgi:hypothetical protein